MDRPLLFSGSMVRALLAGTKTQTRRIVKPHLVTDSHWKPTEPVFWYHPDDSVPIAEAVEFCPYGQPGDRLWVRETWSGQEFAGRDVRVRYQADHATVKADAATIPAGYQLPLVCRRGDGWAPSIHMPRWASRITLEITGVRVERLLAISEADAVAEGAMALPNMPHEWKARERFQNLWESINGPGSWDLNPWVWVVSFKRAVTP